MLTRSDHPVLFYVISDWWLSRLFLSHEKFDIESHHHTCLSNVTKEVRPLIVTIVGGDGAFDWE